MGPHPVILLSSFQARKYLAKLGKTLTVLCSTSRVWLAALIVSKRLRSTMCWPDRAYGVRAMKTIVSALVALSVLAGIVGSTNALDTKTFWEQQERQSY